MFVELLVACLTSQQHASVFQRRICSGNCTCCHTEIEVADPVHSTQVNYDLASDHFSILCSLALQKPKQSAKVVSTRSLNKIDHKNFSSDVFDFITPTLSLADLNTNLSATLDKHAPVRGLKVRDGKPTPWYGAISDQLPALKRE